MSALGSSQWALLSYGVRDRAFVHIDLEHLFLASCHQYFPCSLGGEVHTFEVLEFGVPTVP